VSGPRLTVGPSLELLETPPDLHRPAARGPGAHRGRPDLRAEGSTERITGL
jgi:hypothetical protein